MRLGRIDLEGRRLLQVLNPAHANSPRPKTPLFVGDLLTAKFGDPSLVPQLKQEMLHSDGVDMLVSFIKWSGIRIIKDELKALTRQTRLHGKAYIFHQNSTFGAAYVGSFKWSETIFYCEIRCRQELLSIC